MASTTVARLNALFVADASGFMSVSTSVENRLQTFGDKVYSTASGIAARMAALAGSAAAFTVGYGVKIAAEAEQAGITFEVMLGSAEKARAMLATLKQYADVTPFTQTDLRQASQVLLQYGVDAESIIPLVKMLGDTSAGNAEKLQLQALALAQVSAMGRLQGQELRQLVNAGFNPLVEIGRKTGERITINLEARHTVINAFFGGRQLLAQFVAPAN